MKIKYQLKEKTLYSEADYLHFGQKEIFGETINTSLPDYCGISVGAVIFQSANKKELYALKNHLEIIRLKTIEEGVSLFFDDESALNFYSSKEFEKLQLIYLNEFNLNLTWRFQLEVEGDAFYIPFVASDQQVLEIQNLLQLYFYNIHEISSEDLITQQKVDWEKRLAMLYQDRDHLKHRKVLKDDQHLIHNDKKDNPRQEFKVKHQSQTIKPKEETKPQKPWWKFW